jgi:hypothetical protein
VAVSAYAEVEQFVRWHSDCGGYSFGSTTPTPGGYGLSVSCKCGVAFKRWISPSEAEYDLIWSGLLSVEN